MILYYLLHTTWIGLERIGLILSQGFFYYCSFFCSLIPLPLFEKGKKYFQKQQKNPNSYLLITLWFFLILTIFDYSYVGDFSIRYVGEEILKDESLPVKKEEKKTEIFDYHDTNLYRKYSEYDYQNISFDELREVNKEVVAWILVDNTKINYPVVQTINNDYYLNHDITGSLTSSGWIFMDYRNSYKMDDKNTIVYGHNLINQTAFGSLSIIFTEEWYQVSNHTIVIVNPKETLIYEVFSTYYIDPETYYLQTNFRTDEEYFTFLTTLKNRSIYDYSINLSSNDNIITLSTCTDDNRGRKVIHGKLIHKKNNPQ